ncbi:MAG: hypothetical protein KGQ87_09790 [Verrucomicrobia bacterium]|nr:hypothetical protein [Verrucomicrobiota bacterium]
MRMWAGRWIRQPHGGKGKMTWGGNFLASAQIEKKKPRKSQNNTKQEALGGFYPEIRSRNIIRIILTTDFADLLIIEERIFCDFSLSVQSV